MKINGFADKFPLGTEVPRMNRNREEAPQEEPIKRSDKFQNKVNIPQDFQSRPKLSAAEQKFFEGLYPRARREIQKYLQQQVNVQTEKGKFVDLKG
ncbi:MAG: hypothetical protein Kow0042_03110 [Calditrichia bacterium]